MSCKPLATSAEPILALILAFLTGCGEPAPNRLTEAGLDTLAWVGRAACADCHEVETRSFLGSDHDRAMEVATDESVLGDFDDASFRSCGTTTRFYRDGDAFMVRTIGPNGVLSDFEITHTFGVRPLQQYLISFPDGRRQALTLAWDVTRNRWFSLYGDECVPHDDVLHWTKDAMNWNYMCADCHSTALRRNFNLATNTYATSWSEIDVSCEACHGPGELHLAWARGEEVPETKGAYGLTVDLSRRAPQREEVQVCAPCHSRRLPTYPGFIPGKDYLDHYEPSLLEDGLYFPDGQIHDEVYVYGSFLQSKMHANSVRCSDCHDPHALTTRLDGNALCGQCHAPSQYDVPEHLRHTPGAEAATCIACHMPARTYMVVDPRRDHSFRVPRPDLSVSLGVPNACNGCHRDQSADWAADAIASWTGSAPSDTASFAIAFAGGRQTRPDSEPALMEIVADTSRPDIVRASALHLLRGYASIEATAAARAALRDTSPLVRTVAIRNLERRLQPAELWPLLLPLVEDTVRNVRMEAARVLAVFVGSRAAAQTDADSTFWNALSEYREGQMALSDQPAAHVNVALTYEGLGRLEEAAQAYQSALNLDTSFVPAHLNLAMLLNRRRTELPVSSSLGDSLYRATEASLRRAVAVNPDLADAHYTLGLLLAEDPDRLEEAATHLERAASLDVDNPRIQFNAGLAQQQLGRADRAERLLLAAHALDPQADDYLNALSIFYAQQGRWDEAQQYTQPLAERYPLNQDLQARLAYIRRQGGGPG